MWNPLVCMPLLSSGPLACKKELLGETKRTQNLSVCCVGEEIFTGGMMKETSNFI